MRVELLTPAGPWLRRFAGLALILALVVGHCARLARADGCGPRVRKAWRLMSEQEKQVYKDAVAAALDKGEFFEFTKIHVHHMSERQAHSTCAFLIWHKRFLLGFENMLRAQTEASKCLTVPYWDVMTEYALMVDGKCKNIYDCAPIVRELNGEQSGDKQTLTITDREVSGVCYPGPPGYCDDSKSTCGCVPRADLRKKKIPPSAGFQGLFDQIAFSKDFEAFGKAIQMGVHNEVHSELGGFMATFHSPNDMIFWSWHATIDMLLYTYHQCHLAVGLGPEELKKSVYAFSQDGECKYADDAPDAVVSGDLIQMSEHEGKEYLAAENPVIGRYFKDLSKDIGSMLSFRNLPGDNSYSYEIPEAFKKFLLLKRELCPAFADAVQDPPQPPPPPANNGTNPAPSTVNPTHGFGSGSHYDPGTVRPEGPPEPTPSSSPSPPAPSKKPGRKPKPGKPHDGSSSGGGGDDGEKEEADPNVGDPEQNTPQPQGDPQAGQNPGNNNNNNTNKPPPPPPQQTPPPGPPPPGQGQPPPPPPPPPQGQGQGQPPPPPPPPPPPVDKSLLKVNEDDLSLKTKKYWEWVDTTKDKLQKVFPGNHSEIAAQLQYLECQSFNEQFGIRNFSDQFIKDFKIKPAHQRPMCLKKIDEVDSGKKKLALTTDRFKIDIIDVKPGVTPAPPVPPAPRLTRPPTSAPSTITTTNKKQSASARRGPLAPWLLALVSGVVMWIAEAAR